MPTHRKEPVGANNDVASRSGQTALATANEEVVDPALEGPDPGSGDPKLARPPEHAMAVGEDRHGEGNGEGTPDPAGYMEDLAPTGL
jgi:hypothetical protein